MSRSGRKTLPVVREWQGVPSVLPGVVERPSRMSEIGGEAVPCPEVVGRHSQVLERLSWMSRSGREAHPDVRERVGSPLGCPEVVGWPSRMCGSGLEALPNVWE